MADTKKYVSVKPTRLSSRASVGATTLNVESIQDVLGNTLTMTDFGDKGFGVINPDSTDVRLITFTGVTGTQITGLSETLAKAPYTESSGLTTEFGAGTTVILYTNAPSFYNTFASKNNDETITETWTFTAPNYPKMDSAAVAPTADEQFVTKKYADGLAIAGSPKATNAVYGITLLSTAAVDPAIPIAVGDNDARVPTTGENNALVGNNTDIAVGTGNKYMTQTGQQKQAENYATSTTGNDTYVVTLSPAPTSYAAGMTVRFKPDTTNTGAATINVNSLGAKSILKNGAAALSDGDIPANTVATLVYDGTQFILQGVLPVSVASGAILEGGTSSNADTLHTHNKLIPGLNIYGYSTADLFNYAPGSTNAGFSDATLPLFGFFSGDTNGGGSPVAIAMSTALGTAAYIWTQRTNVSLGSSNNTDCTMFIGSDYWTSIPSSALKKNNAAVSFSGTARYGILGHDVTNSYLLVLYSTTKIAKFSGIAGTTVTNLNSDVTLDTVVDNTRGFMYDNTNQRYICIQNSTTIRRFDSTGTSIDTATYSVDATGSSFTSRVLGLAKIAGRVYVVTMHMFDSGTAATGNWNIAFLPTSMVI